MKLLYTFCVLAFLGITYAEKSSCQSVCVSFLSKFTTASNCTTKNFSCMCSDDIYPESYALCVDACHRPKEIKETWKYMSKGCQGVDIKLDSYEDILAEAQKAYVNQEDVKKKVPVTLPVLISEEDLVLGLRARDSKNHNLEYSEYYGHALNAFWGIFCLISFIRLLTIRLYPRRGSKPNTLVTKFRKYVMLPAAFGHKHTLPNRIAGVPVNVTPLRWQYLVLILFGVANIVFFFVDYDFIANNPNYDTYSLQVIRFYTDRSGILATAMMPVLLLFGGRNNILMLVTGWSFETFNVFHRWVGRAMFIQATLHSVGYTAYYILMGGHEGYVKEIFKKRTNLWGVIAVILAGVILIQGSYVLRHHWYEIFLLGHIVLVAIFIPALRLHLANHGYEEFVWAALAVWAFDRFVRICRIIVAGPFIKADVEVISDSVRIVVAPSLKWKAHPGQYVFLYVLRHNFWESHPFSIMDDKDGKYTLISKAMSGMTKKLYKSVDAKGKTDTVRVWVEGPYGESYPIKRYDTVLLIAGGVGITAIMSYALDLKRRNRDGQHVIFYWIVRDEDCLDWIKNELDELAESEFVTIRIFVTSGSVTNCSSNNSNEKLGDQSTSGSDDDSEKVVKASVFSGTADSVVINYKRPNISAVIESTIIEAPASVAVVTCGPAKLADEARAAVVANVDKGNGRVDYFEDAFAWA